MMGVREKLPEGSAAAAGPAAAAGGGSRVAGTLTLARTLGLLAWRIATLPSRMRSFKARLDDALGDRRPDLTPMRPEELAAYYRRLEGRLLVHWDAPIVNDFATMLFHGLLRRLAATWVGDERGALANDLLAGGGMASEEPARRVRAIAAQIAPDPALVALLCEASLPRVREALRARPDVQAAFDAYIARFGERCMEELKLESPTLHDDPLPLYRAVGRCARANPDAVDAAKRGSGPPQDSPRVAAENRVRDALRRRPLRRLAFAWVLRRARAHVADREDLRFERTRVFGRARQIVVELGRRLATIDCIEAPRDVFFLEFDELLAFAENRATTTDLKGLVAVRKAELASCLALPAPAERFETFGVAYRGNRFGAARPAAPPEGDAMSGTACCPGTVRGRVRLVRDPQHADLQPGEIIVAERTDPGWVMVFPAAAGLLVERGSLLSHSAIVARELGLPTIVSLPGVTRWLHDGDTVDMDGATGRVTRVATEAPTSHGHRG
jgi:pyruvate,water dikinase